MNEASEKFIRCVYTRAVVRLLRSRSGRVAIQEANIVGGRRVDLC